MRIVIDEILPKYFTVSVEGRECTCDGVGELRLRLNRALNLFEGVEEALVDEASKVIERALA